MCPYLLMSWPPLPEPLRLPSGHSNREGGRSATGGTRTLAFCPEADINDPSVRNGHASPARHSLNRAKAKVVRLPRQNQAGVPYLPLPQRSRG